MSSVIGQFRSDHLNEQNADIQFTKEIEENGKLPFLDCLISRDNNVRTTNDSVQKTDAYRQIASRIILQPDFTQSHDYKDFKGARSRYLRQFQHLSNGHIIS